MSLSPELKDKLEEISQRFADVEKSLADSAVLNDTDRYRETAKEHAELSELVDAFRNYTRLEEDTADNKELLAEDDPELVEMAEAEIEAAAQKMEDLQERINVLLLPKDPNDDKNVFLEIRAGTGGEEAALFAGDLLRMYLRYAEGRGWKHEIINSHPTDTGGFKEVIVLISGKGAYSQLKYESGVHRVQRVPTTESQGPHPHLSGHRGGYARGRGGGGGDQPRGAQDRLLPLLRAWRPAREHHRQRGAHHPFAHQLGGSPARTRKASTKTRPRP